MQRAASRRLTALRATLADMELEQFQQLLSEIGVTLTAEDVAPLFRLYAEGEKVIKKEALVQMFKGVVFGETHNTVEALSLSLERTSAENSRMMGILGGPLGKDRFSGKTRTRDDILGLMDLIHT